MREHAPIPQGIQREVQKESSVQHVFVDTERHALTPRQGEKEPPQRKKLRELFLAVSIGLTTVFGGLERNAALAQEHPSPTREAQQEDQQSIDEEIRHLEEGLQAAREKKREQQQREHERREQERRTELTTWARSMNMLLGRVIYRRTEHADGSATLSPEPQRLVNYRAGDARGLIRGSMSEWRGIYDGDEWLGDVKAGAADEDERAIYNIDRRFTKIEFLTSLAKMLERRQETRSDGTEIGFAFFGVDHRASFRRMLEQEFLGERGRSLLRGHGVSFSAGIDAVAIMDRYGYHFTETNGDLAFVPPREGRDGRQQNGIDFNNLTEAIEVTSYGSQGLEVRVQDKGKTAPVDLVVMNRGRVIDVYSGMRRLPSRDQFSEPPVPERE